MTLDRKQQGQSIALTDQAPHSFSFELPLPHFENSALQHIYQQLLVHLQTPYTYSFYSYLYRLPGLRSRLRRS